MSILRRVCCMNQSTIAFADSTLRSVTSNYLTQIHRTPQFSTTAPNPCSAREAQAKNTGNEWKEIYRLPIVRWASAFNRLKLYQGAVSIAGIPAVFILEQGSILPAGSGVTFATVGLTGLVTLLLGSVVVQNLIGFIYIHASGNRLKFAYVDFWGRRKDITMDIDELVPDGAQKKPTRLNFYQLIGIKSNEKFKLKLLQRYGEIANSDLFYVLFY